MPTSDSAPSLVASSDADDAANLFSSDMVLSDMIQEMPLGKVEEGRGTDESSGDTDTTIDGQLLKIKNVPQNLRQKLPIGAPRFEIDAETRKGRQKAQKKAVKKEMKADKKAKRAKKKAVKKKKKADKKAKREKKKAATRAKRECKKTGVSLNASQPCKCSILAQGPLSLVVRTSFPTSATNTFIVSQSAQGRSECSETVPCAPLTFTR